MNLLLVLTNPYSSLDVLARACVTAVKGKNIEVYWLYSNMYDELVQNQPDCLDFFDVVHFVAGVESFSFDLVAKTAKYCRVISTYHHREFSSVPDQFKLVDRLFYVSRFLESDTQTLGIPLEKITLLHNGVDIGIFKPARQPRVDKNFRIGFFGAKPPVGSGDRKGANLLLAAAREMKDQGFSPEFVIVGHGWKELVAQLTSLGLAVSYLVNIDWDQLAEVYNRLDLYLITSYLEGGPLTLLEAGACGTPIISTPVGLALEVLAKPGCGKLLKGFDSHEIAQAVIDDVRNPDQAHERARNVYSEISEQWAWSKSYCGLAQYYQDVSVLKTEKLNQFQAERSSIPYLDFTQKSDHQRVLARSYAMIDFAWRLYFLGDRLRAYQMALPLLGKVKYGYWWNKFLKNVIAISPPGILLRQLLHRI
jgi:glycosyltransferase involved in cell wall biosynthesis